MTARLKTLRDDRVGTVGFERAGLGHGCCRAQYYAAGVLDFADRGSFGKPKMEAGDAWPEFENKVEPFRVETRKRFSRLGDGPEPMLIKIRC